MDQVKIGKFISLKRKEKNITQSKLAEMLAVTDRSVSKWENGICLPDSGTMPELCKILGITINDLFSGQVVDMKNNKDMVDSHLINLKKMNEEANKKLLVLEVFIILISVFSFVLLMLGVDLLEDSLIRNIMVIGGVIILALSIIMAFKIEREVGYYECGKCSHKYVPTFLADSLAMHIGWTKYLKCPKCHKKSWSKKTLEYFSDDDNII